MAALLLSPIANSTVIDTANNSFIDQNTGLEWMDFGINNGKSFNYVSSHLDSDYLGWRLVTQAEAVTLWSSIFSGYPGWRAYNNPLFPELQGYSSGMVPVDANGDSPWLDLIDIIGYNVRRLAGINLPDFYIMSSVGYFISEIDPDGLGYVGLAGYEGCPSGGGCASSAQVVWSGGIRQSPLYGAQHISTLLVRKTNNIPAPGTLGLLCAGLIGLAFKRRWQKVV